MHRHSVGGAQRFCNAKFPNPDLPIEGLAVFVADDLETGGVSLGGDMDRPAQEDLPEAEPVDAIFRLHCGLVAHPVVVPAIDRDRVVDADVLNRVDLETGLLKVLYHEA